MDKVLWVALGVAIGLIVGYLVWAGEEAKPEPDSRGEVAWPDNNVPPDDETAMTARQRLQAINTKCQNDPNATPAMKQNISNAVDKCLGEATAGNHPGGPNHNAPGYQQGSANVLAAYDLAFPPGPETPVNWSAVLEKVDHCP